MDVFCGDIREFDELWAVLKQETNLFDDVVIDDEHIRSHGNELINGENSDLLVIRDSDKIVGVMGILCFNDPLGGQLWAQEHLWYVLPDHRGMPAFRLLKMAKEWAKEKGCTHIVLSANALISNMHETICTLYEKMGMKKCETSYIERL